MGAATSRRQRNQPSKQHDLEFAAELGQGLIAEVRKLQGLLAEREEALKIVQVDKSRLEQHAASIEARLKSMDDSEQRFKDENWNLELQVQNLHSQLTVQKDAEARMQSAILQLENEKTAVIKELDEVRARHTKMAEELEAKCKHNETEIGSLRRTLATTDSEKTTLQRAVEELKMELEESHNTSMRLRNMQERKDMEDQKDPFAISVESDDEADLEPPATSAIKHATPRHGQLEAETLKSSLHHAHRLIQNLRSNLHREKTEKTELRRLLQESRDELETARNLFSSPPQKEKRRRADGTYKKLPRMSINLLGGHRRSRDEITVDTSAPVDDEWEEAKEEDNDGNFRRAPGAYFSSAPPTDVEESGFETAHEKRTSSLFDTAAEGPSEVESPINDGPTSADELTETEGSPQRILRPKASELSTRSLRPLRLSKLRHQRSSIVSTASTEDDEDEQFRMYQFAVPEQDGSYSPDGRYDDDALLRTPGAVTNPRMKLRIRGRSKGARVGSDNSMFNSNVFDSSPGSLNSPMSINNSPRAFRYTAAPDIRKSLFAELGQQSPGQMSTYTDGDDDLDDPQTPVKKLSPALFPREMVQVVHMVDCGVNTEEPYPDLAVFMDDSASEFSERPSTAVTVVGDAGFLAVGSPFEKKAVMADASVQNVEIVPVVAEAGMQSDKISMFEMGTQSEKVRVGEMGTQSDAVPVPITRESGTQYDTVPSPVMHESGTQYDNVPPPATFETGTQSDKTPVPITFETGTQSDAVLVAKTFETGMQSEAIPAASTSEIGTQSEPESDDDLVVVPIPIPIPAPVFKVKMSDSGTQFDPEDSPVSTIVHGGAVEVAPVEDPVVPRVIMEIVHGDAVEVTPVEEVVLPVNMEIVHGDAVEVAPVEEVVPPVKMEIVHGDAVEVTPVEEVVPPVTLEIVRGESVEVAPVSPVEEVVPPIKLEIIHGESVDVAPMSPVEEALPTLTLVRGETLETVPVTEEAPAPRILVVAAPAIKTETKEVPAFVMVKGESIETEPVEEPVPAPVVLASVVKEEIRPFVVVKGESIETEPVEELAPAPVVLAPIVKEEIRPFVIVKGEAVETEPVEEPVLETPAKMPLILDFSNISQLDTTPISVLSTPKTAVFAPVPVPILISSAGHSAYLEDVAPKKIHEAADELMRPVTPTPSMTPSIERRGFFGSLFGPRKATTPTPTKKEISVESDWEDGKDGEETIRRKDANPRPALSVPAVAVSDQSIQTDPHSEYSDKVPQGPKKTIFFGSISDASSIRDRAQSPSIRSRASMESMIGRGRGRMSTEGLRIVSAGSSAGRPESAASNGSSFQQHYRMQYPPLPENHQEHIAAAQHKTHEVGGSIMPPPPIPVRSSTAVSFRPRTASEASSQLRRPETPGSSNGATPKPPRFTATRSDISSPDSRCSSLSSFATELDDRFNMQNDGYPADHPAQQQGTDPRVIQAITQTMIGEYLWKYTRNTGRGTISHTRHKRFFWIHPYTRTLYWSDRDPQSAGRAELRAKSVAIEAVRVVADDNPTPVGLHRKSLIIITPGRTLKFTAPTSQRHETWFNALSYLLLRDGQEPPTTEEAVNDEDLRDFDPTLRPTMREVGSLSSFRSRTTRDSSPSRNASALSRRERERMQGSLSRLGSMFRPGSAFSTRPAQDSFGIDESEEEGGAAAAAAAAAEETAAGIERMENVRACCDGKFCSLSVRGRRS